MTTPKRPGAQIWQIYPPVLTSHGQEWQLADLPLHLPGDLPPMVLTSSDQEWQFHIAIVTAYIGRSTGRSTPSTDIWWSRMAISHCYCYSLYRQINW